MILGIGTDIVEVERIDAILEKYSARFLDRYFTPREKEYALSRAGASRTVAGRFAAKEAVSKALGTGFKGNLSMKDIEIINDTLGKPQVILSPHIQEHFHNPKILISISHEQKYAVAFALWQE
jgi:holo-[acyl-carrier protein] synthase